MATERILIGLVIRETQTSDETVAMLLDLLLNLNQLLKSGGNSWYNKYYYVRVIRRGAERSKQYGFVFIK